MKKRSEFFSQELDWSRREAELHFTCGRAIEDARSYFESPLSEAEAKVFEEVIAGNRADAVWECDKAEGL